MIVGVVGSRNFKNWTVLKAVLDKFHTHYPIDIIVSGGAEGADYYAYVYAKKTGINFVCYPPLREDLLNYGFSEAARRRNRRIVEYCDRLVAFPMKGSKGTWHSVGLARELEKPYTIYEYEEDQ